MNEESNRHCFHDRGETKDLMLPGDIFPGRFRYQLIVRKFYSLFLLSCIVLCIFSAWLARKGPQTFPIVGLCYVLLAVVFSPFVFIGMFDYKHKIGGNLQCSLSLLGEVVKVRPGFDINEWDAIAARLNKRFHQIDDSITPYFFL
ncbi:hypothetical protein BZL39_A09020 [Zygosaccharomyces parabailii]|nr:hypothetical protein BZL39_A09020 [Zygosaccharomyces parabailii]